ncbi:MAG: RsmD family RNA methyltransferase [Ignisphaera sp.]
MASDAFVYEKTFVFKLSNELFSIALSEFNSIIVADNLPAKTIHQIDEFVIAETDEKTAMHLSNRASLILESGHIIGVFDEDDLGGLSNLIINYLKTSNTCIRFDAIRGFGKESIKNLMVLLHGFSWSRCREVVKVAFIGGIAIAYHVMYRRKELKFLDREPHKRPCYRPGTMKPRLARALVNLAKLSSVRKQIMLDPFCGVGGIVLEACSMGIHSICSDIDTKMCMCAKENIKHFKCDEIADIVLGDASREGIRGYSVDAVVTDPPYGIQSSPKGFGILDLLKNFITVSSDVIKPNGYMVFAIPIQYESIINAYLQDHGFEIKEKHINRVHGSLTRLIYVVRKV